MPDEDRRGVALLAMGWAADHAHELYPGASAPGTPRGSRPRFYDVLELLSHGHDRKSVARELFIGEQTVMSHLKKARAALEAKSTAHAIATALRRGLIE